MTESVIDAQIDGTVTVDEDGDSVSFESDDGNTSISFESGDGGETGSISGTDESGDEFTIDIGIDEIPDDFPMPVFTPSKVAGVIESDTSDGISFIVKLVVEKSDADAVLAFYEEWITSEGMDIVTRMEIGLGGILAGSETAVAQISILDGPPVEVLLTWTPIG